MLKPISLRKSCSANRGSRRQTTPRSAKALRGCSLGGRLGLENLYRIALATRWNAADRFVPTVVRAAMIASASRSAIRPRSIAFARFWVAKEGAGLSTVGLHNANSAQSSRKTLKRRLTRRERLYRSLIGCSRRNSAKRGKTLAWVLRLARGSSGNKDQGPIPGSARKESLPQRNRRRDRGDTCMPLTKTGQS
jgi:hypothetical protein